MRDSNSVMPERIHRSEQPDHPWVQGLIPDARLGERSVVRVTAGEGGTVISVRYRLKSTGRSSEYFGVCEVCGRHASDVFIQVPELAVSIHPIGGASRDGWAYKPSGFGHRSCLLGRRTMLEEALLRRAIEEQETLAKDSATA